MKKKGFTLIELLAVIVILAIIALIATPIVLNIIKDSKNSSTLQSADFYLSAIETAITKENDTKGKLKNTECKIGENGNLKCDGYEKELKIEINGELPSSGKIIIKENKIDEIEFYYEDKLIVKDENDKLIYTEAIYELVKDSNPGIICGEGTKEDLTMETCYIKSIEDLVELSTLVNKGTTFENKKVELVYSLDFNSKRSYASKKIDESLITGVGFTPIGYSSARSFKGTFEGNNNTIRGVYINRPNANNVGLFGYVSGNSNLISNLKLEDVNIIGKSSVGTLIGVNVSSIVENVTLKNITIETIIKVENAFVGGLIGLNYSTKVINTIAENVNINAKGSYVGGLIGQNSGELIQNIFFNNINVSGGWYSAGVVGATSNVTVKKIIGDNFKIKSTGRYSGGLIGRSDSSLVTQVKLTNVDVEGQDRIGVLLGHNTYGTLSYAKADGNIKGTTALSLAIGFAEVTGVIDKVVVKGNIEGTTASKGGFVGQFLASTDYEPVKISGVFLSEGVSLQNRVVGYAPTLPIMNTLVSSKVLVNGNPVVSDDPTSVNGKSLDDMGKASQSEYEALGFEFGSTEENEAYWYFNENDELDLFIKELEK